MIGENLIPATDASSATVGSLVDQLIEAGPQAVRNPAVRKIMAGFGERWIMGNLRKSRLDSPEPPGVNDDQTAISLAILRAAERALTEYKLSEATVRGLMGVLARDQLVDKHARREKAATFAAQYGQEQPSFLTISPSRACNLHCTGCYADSDAVQKQLEWEIVDRLVSEAMDLWASQLMVISGGEPLAYRSQGKTVLDLAEAHPNCFFMMFTNGTLIDDATAERMARLGNLLPAISLEGWEERTDARRGAGVYQKVMAAMQRLHRNGVPFGVSLTATRHNAEELLSEDFIDFLYEEKHALFGWVFQYMPIGRSLTLDLMPTPQQRLWMWRRSWDLVRNKRIFLADFWNHGTAVGGCLSAGGYGKGGYMYINWNGSVSPCVFVPYSPVNIHTVYARGGNLNDVFMEPFFAGIRAWQKEYQHKNLMAPCVIRDHNDVLRRLIGQYEPEPIDANAQAALLDPAYGAGLDTYSAEFQQLAGPVWDEYYCRPVKKSDVQLGELPQLDPMLAESSITG
ncbi:MAG: radical SAM protein [Chloroflexi bacterium]|nr:radical SAM protein [Chloroflexota bacterium]